MIDLLTTLYDLDAFRFPLWGLLQEVGLDGIILWTLKTAGCEVFEDWSITFP